uniref:Uncharacterized protein n=1 Tax=Anguilla anguilla TaxID=7936 RepID=A0A0E9XVF7_ANGAN
MHFVWTGYKNPCCIAFSCHFTFSCHCMQMCVSELMFQSLNKLLFIYSVSCHAVNCDALL